MPRREPPAIYPQNPPARDILEVGFWMKDCLTDMRDGKHARGCRCVRWQEWEDSAKAWRGRDRPNACTEIARCALEMEGYDVD